MTNETVLRKLEKKAIGFSIGAVKIFGKDAAQPGGPVLVIRSVEQTAHGVVKLSCAVQPEAGKPDAPHVQIAIGEPDDVKITAAFIEVAAARYVRFEELIAVASGKAVALSLAGGDASKAIAGAPVLLLLAS